jgi:hypothetical protein
MISIKGSISAQVDAVQRQLAARMRAAVDRTAQETQGELRALARAAKFKDGGRSVANTWRRETFPKPGVGPKSLRPAALVWSKLPAIVEGFNADRTIAPKGGGLRMAIPTKYNLRSVKRGRRNLIYTTLQMSRLMDQGAARIAPSRRNRSVLLWYIRVNKPGKRQKRSWVARKYRFGKVELSSKGIQREWVPMFTLIKPYQRKKLWDLAEVAKRARARLGTAMRAAVSA